MLIGEIIPYVYRYLKDNPAAAERNLYDYVLVDEYQDLNKAEQGVIDLLCDAASYYQEGALENHSAQERLAILKLVVNPQDRIALRWLLGFGRGDFRSGAYARLRAHCEHTGTTPWDVMTALADGKLQIPHTHHLVTRFKAIRNEISELDQAGNVQEFVERWLGVQVAADEPFQVLARELSTRAQTAAELLEALIAAVSLPDIPPDVAEVRIMSLHKSKGLVHQS
jgi:ATP-dependent exoDNAse (exonuclease V) beta subunit